MAKVGDVVGSYRLEEEIGSGAMGRVFRGSHTVLPRTVAVKVLNDELSRDQEYVSRFIQEAKIVNAVRHPNIIDISDYVNVDEDPPLVAYVMELLQGMPLNDVLLDGPLTEQETVTAGLQLVSALKAVHRVNVVHRDLKPENIFVLGASPGARPPHLTVKILDFGIAKAETMDAAHRTRTGFIIGTPAYMAPEQVFGEPVSAATDIYALGEILFEMATGERLFKGPMAEVMRQKIDRKAKVQLPSIGCGARLSALIEQCIAVPSAERPPLDVVSAELLAIQRGESQVATVPPTQRSAPPPDAPTRTVPARSASGRATVRAESNGKPAAPATGFDPAAISQVSPYSETLEQDGLHAPSHGSRFALMALVVALLSGGTVLAFMGKLPHLSKPASAKADAPAPPPPPKVDTPVAILSDPPNAEVFEGDQAIGLTPLTLQVAPGVTRTIELRLAGYVSRKVEVNGKHDRVSYELLPEPAKPKEERGTSAARGPRRSGRAEREGAKGSGGPSGRPPAATVTKPLRRDEVTPW